MIRFVNHAKRFNVHIVVKYSVVIICKLAKLSLGRATRDAGRARSSMHWEFGRSPPRPPPPPRPAPLRRVPRVTYARGPSRRTAGTGRRAHLASIESQKRHALAAACPLVPRPRPLAYPWGCWCIVRVVRLSHSIYLTILNMFRMFITNIFIHT